MVAMQIDVFGLREGHNALHFEETLDALELPEHLIPRGPVHLAGSLYKQGTQLVVRATLYYELASECNRCLEPVGQAMQTPLEAGYQISPTVPAETNDEEVTVISVNTQFIDLTEPIREAMLLAVPLKSLCRQDCRGLCPICGMNLNTETCTCKPSRPDPRWAPLQTLRT